MNAAINIDRAGILLEKQRTGRYKGGRVAQMTRDTKAIIGTILVAAVGILAAVMAVGALLQNEMRGVQTGLQNQMESMQTGLQTQIEDLGDRVNRVETRLGERIDRLDTAMKENYHRLDDRMRRVEEGFARVDPRLDTLERAIIPSADPAE